MKKMSSWEKLTGNTPLAAIRYEIDGSEQTIYAKLEWYNPSGSIKDRIAWYMIEEAEREGRLQPGQPIVEMTSGNTGIALAAVGAFSGHPVSLFMPDWASEERKKLMKMYGASLYLVSEEDGGFQAARKLAALAAREMGAFTPDQFSNTANARAHELTTGKELLKQLPEITDFVAGVGSGGTLMGTARLLKSDHCVRAVAVEPKEAALLSGSTEYRKHRIEGIGDAFIPPLIDMREIDVIEQIHDGEAIYMAQRLARELGLGVGISSGAAFLGAVRVNKPGHSVATVFADDSKKYLTAGLSEKMIPQDNWLSAKVKLLGFDMM